MDPYTRQETVQLSFLSNIYEPLARWNRELKLEPALAASWEQTSPTVWRFHLRPDVKWQDGSPFTADDVVFSLQRILAKTLGDARADGLGEGGPQDRRPHRRFRDRPAATRSSCRSRPTSCIMSKAWCEAHNATEPVLIDASKDENFAVRNAMGTGPFKLDAARAGPPHRGREEPPLVGQAAGQCRPGRVRRHRQRVRRASRRCSRARVDMIYTVPPQDMDRGSRTPTGLKLLQTPELRTIFLGIDESRRRAADLQRQGQEPAEGRARAPRLRARDRRERDRRARDARPGASDLADVGARHQRLRPEARRAADGRSREAKKLLAEAGYPDGFGIQLDCPNDRYVDDEAICTAIVPMLARIGVKVTLNAQTKTQHFGLINTPNFHTDFYLLGWTPGDL